MSEKALRKETDFEVVGWLESLRDWAPRYRHADEIEIDHLGRVIDEDKAAEKNFVVVPMSECWAPEEEQDKIFPVLKAMGCTRLYGLGYLYEEELHFSAPVERDAICQMIFNLWGYCLMVPRNESFLIMHTNFEYWLLAGPASLVQRMLGTSIDSAFEAFSEAVAAGGDDEPGAEFSADIVSRYRRHNERILSKNA